MAVLFHKRVNICIGVYMGSNHWVLMSKTHRPFVETPCWSLIEYLVEEVVKDLVEDLVDVTD